MVNCEILSILSKLALIVFTISKSEGREEGYLGFVKDGCFKKGEMLSCVKYKALKLATKTIFGNMMHSNETYRASNAVSFVHLDPEYLKHAPSVDNYTDLSKSFNEPRGYTSEWTELTKYGVLLFKDFFKTRGLKVALPEGARTIEEEEVNEAADGRGKRKRLALILPLLSLLATLKVKLLLIPVLLAVLLLKKLLLLAAVLLPGLLSTLKSCKTHHPQSFYSHWGNSDSSDVSSGYGNNYAYSTGGGYGKDWPSNRAYNLQKPRPTPMYITAPGSVA